jgi:hypothetical protein
VGDFKSRIVSSLEAYDAHIEVKKTTPTSREKN